MTRDERQASSVTKWRTGSKLGNGTGTIEGCTGFGKTRIATIVAQQLQTGLVDAKIIVIVPTIPLQNQWTKILTDLDIKNFEVYVINTVVLSLDLLDCTLLILDEIHMYAADTFYQLFDVISYKYIMGLTATIERLDGKHSLLEKKCPIVDIITLEVALKNSWVADHIEYNLYIDLDKEQKEEYDKINDWINSLFPIFQFDYYRARTCCKATDTYYNGEAHPGAISFITNYKKNYGEILRIDDGFGTLLIGRALLNDVIKKANNLMRLFHKREQFIASCPLKVSTTLAIIRKLGMKTVTFGKSTEVADEITKQLNENLEVPIAASYHSYLKAEIRPIPKIKTYANAAPAEKYCTTADNGYILPNDIKGYDVHYTKDIKFGSGRLKKEVIAKLDDDRIEVVNTAKALDLGLDVTGMQLAVVIDGHSNPTTHEQRKGRVIRKELIGLVDKIAIIVNIVLKGTQDEKWTKRRQIKNSRHVRHITNIEQIEV